MSDVFINEAAREHIERMLARIHQLPQHSFQILCKRPQRIAMFFEHHQ